MTTEQAWERIASHISAAIPIAIESDRTEETFILEEFFRRIICELDQPIPVHVWDVTTGFSTLIWNDDHGIIRQEFEIKSYRFSPDKPPFAKALEAMTFLAALKEYSGLFIFLDGHRYLNAKDDMGMVFFRQMQNTIESLRRSGSIDDKDYGHVRRIAFLGEAISINPELSKMIPLIRLPHLTEQEILDEIRMQGSVFCGNPDYEGYFMPPEDDAEVWMTLIRNAQGLSRRQIEQAIARSAADHGMLCRATADYFYEAKLSNLQVLGLSVYPPPKNDVGGLNNLRRWLNQRIVLFNNPHSEDALRGILVVGIPGCGKSLMAVTMGQMLKAPVILLQADRIFGSLVGQSEQQLRAILNAVEQIAPSVLWIDEIEKCFSTSATDSVGSKILGMFLSWMQEKPPGVVVVATANSLESLPPELLRKGRFDEIFFVDLPQTSEREQIVRIHLQKRGHQTLTTQLESMIPSIVNWTDGYSGAEIAEVIKSAELTAQLRGEPGQIRLDDIKAEIDATLPLSRQEPDRIAGMRKAAQRFRPAHIEESSSENGTGRSAPSRISARRVNK